MCKGEIVPIAKVAREGNKSISEVLVENGGTIHSSRNTYETVDAIGGSTAKDIENGTTTALEGRR